MNTPSVISESVLFQPVKWVFSALQKGAAFIKASFMNWVETDYNEAAIAEWESLSEEEKEQLQKDFYVADIYFFPYFYL